jgi:hypothetical protein
MSFGVLINFTDGCRAFLRAGYEGAHDLIACDDWKVTSRAHLAARFTLHEAERWVNDLHRKQPHMDSRGVRFAEVCIPSNFKQRRFCAHHNQEGETDNE